MCIGCYQEMGSPRIVNEATTAAARLVRRVYETHPGGGAGHIVFDDFNLEDDNIEWCIENGPSMDDQTMAALLAFQPLTEDERASALALFEGWIEEPERRR